MANPLKLRFEQDIILKEQFIQPFSSFSSSCSFSLLTSSSAFESLNETTLVKPGGWEKRSASAEKGKLRLIDQ